MRARAMLQHVSIETKPADAEACARFYELVGFHAVDPPPTLAGRALWVERGGTQIHLLLTDAPVVAPKAHHALVVDDYDAALAALRGAGFEPETRDEHWGAARSFVTDPAGHRVELMAAPPPRHD